MNSIIILPLLFIAMYSIKSEYTFMSNSSYVLLIIYSLRFMGQENVKEDKYARLSIASVSLSIIIAHKLDTDFNLGLLVIYYVFLLLSMIDPIRILYSGRKYLKILGGGGI